MQQLKLEYIRKIVFVWLAIGGSKKIELAALEPLLWKQNDIRIPELVSELKAMGCHVSLTTNGSLLEPFAQPLQQAGIDLVRLSWHTLNPDTFHQITGQNAYSRFMNGLESAIDVGLPLAVNRVLLRGYCEDLAKQISFIDQHHLRLKLLDLYWMPAFHKEYERFYINPAEVITDNADPQMLTLDGRVSVNHTSRDRIRYKTPQGGVVEYKLHNEASRSIEPCKHCIEKDNCLEGFGDYLRIFPNDTVSLCYMRPDLGLSLPINKIEYLPEWLQKQNTSLNMPLRLVLTGQCNFNCGFPGSEQSWCLKQGRGFKFPRRRLDLNKVDGVVHVQSV